jgi:hypothetical protein
MFETLYYYYSLKISWCMSESLFYQTLFIVLNMRNAHLRSFKYKKKCSKEKDEYFWTYSNCGASWSYSPSQTLASFYLFSVHQEKPDISKMLWCVLMAEYISVSVWCLDIELQIFWCNYT